MAQPTHENTEKKPLHNEYMRLDKGDLMQFLRYLYAQGHPINRVELVEYLCEKYYGTAENDEGYTSADYVTKMLTAGIFTDTQVFPHEVTHKGIERMRAIYGEMTFRDYWTIFVDDFLNDPERIETMRQQRKKRGPKAMDPKKAATRTRKAKSDATAERGHHAAGYQPTTQAGRNLAGTMNRHRTKAAVL